MVYSSWRPFQQPTPFRGLLLPPAASPGVVRVRATQSDAAPQLPRVVAVVPSGTGWKLEPLDGRTLGPIPGAWSRAVRRGASVALSPSGSRVAVVGQQYRVFIASTTTGRTLRNYREPVLDDIGFYWLGDANGNDSRGEPVIVAEGFDCSSGGCGPEVAVVGSGLADGFGMDFVVGAFMPEGLVFASDPTEVSVYGSECPAGQSSCGTYFTIPLSKMPKEGPFGIVGDVAHDRVFELSSAGLVAEVDHILARKPTVIYHRTELNGQPFQAIWAGAGKIALWGKDGLGTIDTRTWKTHAIAPGVTAAVATPYGIAAWTADPADGLTVYRPDGTLRFRVLAGKTIKSVKAVGDYLYADADARYSLNLRTGRVLGPLRSSATIIEPDLVLIR